VVHKEMHHGARVFIDYAWPDSIVGHWLGALFAKTYARWCTRRMVTDAVAGVRCS